MTAMPLAPQFFRFMAPPRSHSSSSTTRLVRRISGFLILVPFCISAQSQLRGRIIVAPNVQVSLDGDVPHIESHLASDPSNANHLVGSAIAFTSSGAGYETKAYSSFDGGWTWHGSELPGNGNFGSWDTEAAIGVRGSAYVITMQNVSDSDSAPDALAFYRSVDGGISWSGPSRLGYGEDYDRNAIVVDKSSGTYRGRIYVVSHASDGVHLFRSADDGRTFEGPVRTGCGGAYDLLILSDGTLWFPCAPNDGQLATRLGRSVAATSTDGGATFSFDGLGARSAYATYAVDTSPRFRDRIYIIERETNRPLTSTERRGTAEPPRHLVLRSSVDRGKTWSPPRRVAFPSTPGATQFLPAIAVNDSGIVGLLWFETTTLEFGVDEFTEARPNFASNAYFTASLDGGSTFLHARRISADASKPAHPENLALTRIGPMRRPARSVLFLSAYARWRGGGDYTGLASDADGTFHPFWPDARRGAFQIYSSRVFVDTAPIPVPPRASTDTDDVNRFVQVVFGPPVAPNVAGEGVLLAKLRNASSDTIWGPLEVHVAFADLSRIKKLRPTVNGPLIFDPAAKRWALEATIGYASALRDIPYLAPGATTESIAWRMRRAGRAQRQLLITVRHPKSSSIRSRSPQ